MQKIIIFKLVHSLLPDAFILCSLDKKVKTVISNLKGTGTGFSKNMAVINQHATVEKKTVKVCFLISYSLYLWFGFNLRHMMMTHMYCEMQNKLSNTRGSPFGSMGEIISSRCPY